MTDISRRDWVKTMGVVGAGAVASPDLSILARTAHGSGDIVELTSTSEIFIPPRGRSYQKFSYDFPEPSVVFGAYRFGFLVFTDENTYGLDRSAMHVDLSDDTLRLTCDRLVWAGGQERAPGKLVATLRQTGQTIDWTVTAEMSRPVKTVTTIVRGVPRGRVSFGGGGFPPQANDSESLAGYPFGGGDLNASGSMSTPLLMIQNASDVFYVSSLDDRVRPKRFYLAP